jgi:hypothetical protein
VLAWFVRGSPASPLRKVVITMSDNFWERDYVIEHLRVCPGDYEFLESLRTLGDDVYSDIVGLNDIEYNLYLNSRAVGRDHTWSLRYCLDPELMCLFCERLRGYEEVELATCYDCSTKAALRG